MKYRKFDKFETDISTFGFGCMRFPLEVQADGSTDSAKIDEEEAIKMIRHAVDSGVNYFDTAYGYHGGNSEILVGKALKDGYREKVHLVSKLPVWLTNTVEDFSRIFEEQLEKLQTDYLDFYLLHALNKDSWNKVKDMGVLDFLDELKASGKIKYAGFSFHDELDVFKDIVDSYDWDMCQIQLNILDEEYQAGAEGLKYAAAKDIPVVIMEPLRGGRLANDVPQDVDALWKSSGLNRSPVEWAFRWLYNFPEILTILSGVSNMEQLEDNIRIFSDAEANVMTQNELDIVEKVKDLYNSKIKIGCTACEYCLPCPSGVDIPGVFRLFNDYYIFGESDEFKEAYRVLLENGTDASKCIECEQCEEECPQFLEIIDTLKVAHEVLTA